MSVHRIVKCFATSLLIGEQQSVCIALYLECSLEIQNLDDYFQT